jgi:hypothetical protein
MRSRKAKWEPIKIRAKTYAIPTEKYEAQIKHLSRLLYGFYSKRKPDTEIKFEDLETQLSRPRRRAA